jgi:Flp pilus assembly protein TadB
MIVAVVAMVLLYVVMYFRMIGMASMRSRWLREDGKVQQSKLEMAFVLAICVGTFLALLGVFLHVSTLRVLGIIAFGCSLPIMVSRLAVNRRDARGSVKK